MNDAMLRLFAEHEKIDGPPLGVSSEQLAKRGRRRLMGRNLGFAGGLTAAVALAVVGALTLSSAFVVADAPPGTGKEQPEYPLPDLPKPPDGQRYAWGYQDGDKSSPDADEYGKAFTEWFNDNGTDLEKWPGMAVNHRLLYRGSTELNNWKVVDDSIPYYGIATVSLTDPGGDPEVEWDEIVTDRVRYGEANDLGFKVYPRGSFESGAGDTFEHLATCTDGLTLEATSAETVVSRAASTQDLEPDHTCDESTGPGGERILRIHTEWKTDGGFMPRQDNRVIVIRADGTAVDVDTYVYRDDETDAGNKLGLSLDELTDLALAMPDATVKD
ncbi:hypothetical protein [Stackebrandtia nassauensis]|uniref:Uncharacterized protein n=1 Tax=Stackebrandtia nassauensis (strain DSM 44728 / CIP 108903 / NRRL B-16338 / NBRC 102104 / LLR-40K-21) TaxID=446470 RepID=D3Q6G7_STANL|nr:hypothetical protein [Stackebrandtia nassauensis]ADD44210.1 hypothetical protein Snas_4566 [Stackebrandtia nassauensis DSM 44728]